MSDAHQTMVDAMSAATVKLTEDTAMDYVFNTLNMYCDACTVARAQVTVVKGNHSEDTDNSLKLCAHHFTVNAAVLLFSGWEVTEDNRDSLLVKTASTTES